MGYKRNDLAVRVDIQSAKGYTMKEIYALEQRIKNLEYYTVLNALALDTKTLSLPSTNPSTYGIERFKNGIFADPFNDDTIARSNDPEFSMAISSSKSIARPNYTETYNDLEIDTTNSTAIKIQGRYLLLNYTSVKIGGNDKATMYRNCAETFYSYQGAVTLYPNFDYTNTTSKQAPQTISVNNAQNYKDAAAAGAFKDIDTTYGAPKVTSESGSTNYWGMDVTQTVTDIAVTSKTTTQNLGNFVKDVSLLAYMKGRKIGIVGQHLRPGSIVYPFFDEKLVSQYCCMAKISTSFLKNDGTIDADKVSAASGSDPANMFTPNGTLGGPFTVNSYGDIVLIFNLPDNTFRGGERVFLLTNVNNLTNKDAIITTAEGVYSSQGLSVTTQNLSFSVTDPVFTPTTVTNVKDPLTWTTQDPPPPQVVYVSSGGGGSSSGGGGGSPPPESPPSVLNSCFDPEAKVLMADGTEKKICEIQLGDKVRSGLGTTSYNNVIGIEAPAIGNRKMYSFNNNWAFVSEEHPIMTENGWGAFDPESWAVEDNFKGKLVKIDIGTKVLRYDGDENGIFESINTIDSISKPEDYTIYNLLLDGDNTYIVENYVVHNKGSDGGGYYSGDGGYGSNGGGNSAVGSGPGGTVGICLVPWALIEMEDGAFKEIQNIIIGDKVKSMNGGTNNVLHISPLSNSVRLVSINDSDYFLTETHPLYTEEGWGTFNVELLKNNNSKEYDKIVEDNNGKELIEITKNTKLAKKINGKIEYVQINDLKFKEVNDFTVYRISVDGDSTYISENYVSHNKPI
jgi:hypothetical protein